LTADGWSVLGTFRTNPIEDGARLDLRFPKAGLTEIDAELGERPVDLLVLNGVEGQFLGLGRTKPEEFEEYLAAHLGGNWLVLEHLWARLEKARGSVVFVSSLAASGRAHTGVSYAVAKAAFEGRLIDLEQRSVSSNIRLLSVELGLVDTPLLGAVRSPVLARARSSYPELAPEEVAAAILGLIEVPARVLRGTTVDLHGGYVGGAG
jgi:NAD(P)-dependent dehydrogenase (short-subunit alcohol dehydrogenase family)